MKYLALGVDGEMHNLGDCGDIDSAFEVADDTLLETFYITTIKEWKRLAQTIIMEESE